MSETKNKAGELCGNYAEFVGDGIGCNKKRGHYGNCGKVRVIKSSRTEQSPPVPSAPSKRCNYKPHNVECNKVVEFKLIDSDTGHEFFVCGEHEPDYAARNKRAGREVFVIIKLPAERVVPPEPSIEALQAKVSRLEQALREIIEMSPKEKPEEKDSTWGNEGDAEYHGFKSAAWLAGEIARAALSGGEQP